MEGTSGISNGVTTRSLETFGDEQNLTFSNNNNIHGIDNSLLKIFSSSQKKKRIDNNDVFEYHDVDSASSQLEKYRKILEKMSRDNAQQLTFAGASSSIQTGAAESGRENINKYAFERQELHESALSFDMELERRLRGLESKKLEALEQRVISGQKKQRSSSSSSNSPQKEQTLGKRALEKHKINKKKSSETSPLPKKGLENRHREEGAAVRGQDYNVYHGRAGYLKDSAQSHTTFSVENPKRRLDFQQPDDLHTSVRLSDQKQDDIEVVSHQSRTIIETDTVQSLESDYTAIGAREIVTNAETLRFLEKHFAQFLIKSSPSQPNLRRITQDQAQGIRLLSFANALQREYSHLQIQNLSEEEREHFLLHLQDSLTTHNANYISITALEVQTREVGLGNKINQLLQESQASYKKSQSEKIQAQIVQELQGVKVMLDAKRRELVEQERLVAAATKAAVEREHSLQEFLKQQYDYLMQQLDIECNQKVAAIVKRVAAQERSLKNKLKIVEQRIRENMEANAQQVQSDERWKAKAQLLEKQNEFHKAKCQDLEKKLSEQRTTTENLQSKNELLLKRLREAENRAKEAETRVREKQQPPGTDDLFVDGSPIKGEVAQEGELQGQSPGQANADEGISDQTISELRELFPAVKNLNQNNSKGAGTVATTKKAGAALSKNSKKVAAPGKGTAVGSASDEEVKLLLSILGNILNCLRQTLPALLSNRQPDKNLHSPPRTAPPPLDLGEIFFPAYNQLVCNFVDVFPSLLGKSGNNAREICTLIELFSRMVAFAFRFQLPGEAQGGGSTLLDKSLLQSQQNQLKSSQDHVNEVMMLGQRQQASELVFVPQTTFWKRKLKSSSAVPVSVKQTQQQQPAVVQRQKPVQAYFSLFFNDDVQRELIQVLLQFIHHSDLQLRQRKSVQSGGNNPDVSSNNNNQQQFFIPSVQNAAENQEGASQLSVRVSTRGLEQQKHTLMARVNVHTLVAILALSPAHALIALRNLNDDLNIDGDALSTCLKKYLVQQRAVALLLWRLCESRQDLPLAVAVVDILLNLSGSGVHYDEYIDQLAQGENVQTLFAVFEAQRQAPDLLEKLSVVLQRLSYHSAEFRACVNVKHIALLKSVLAAAAQGFLASNLTAILKNLNV